VAANDPDIEGSLPDAANEGNDDSDAPEQASV